MHIENYLDQGLDDCGKFVVDLSIIDGILVAVHLILTYVNIVINENKCSHVLF